MTKIVTNDIFSCLQQVATWAFSTSALMTLINLFCDCAFIIYFVLCKVGFIIAKVAINTFFLHN